MSMLEAIATETRATLDRYGFDPEQFETLRARVARGELSQMPDGLTAILDAVGQ